MKEENLSWSQVAAIGDDLNDYNMLKKVGLSFTPANGTHYLKEFVNVVCKNKGGEGAVREMLEYIFKETLILVGMTLLFIGLSIKNYKTRLE